jgi:hypothetical protein
MRLPCISTIVLVLLAAPALAQSVGPGLMWNGTLGGTAGSFFPSCTNLPVVALRGDAVALRVWGDFGSVYLLGTAASANQCLPFPGIGNGLVLDLPAFPVASGLLTLVSPCLSCPPAFDQLLFTVPQSLPIGAMVSFQAAGFGNGQFTFTVAITATVQ